MDSHLRAQRYRIRRRISDAVCSLHGGNCVDRRGFCGSRSPRGICRRQAGRDPCRARILCEVVTGVRKVWPEKYPLFVRISATDWVEGGWTLDDSVALARLLPPLGVDLIDCSSGGNVAGVKTPVAAGYQVPFAERIRRQTGIATGAVG